MSRKRPAGADPVVITFDDGTEDFVQCALPALDRLCLESTIYLATDFIESGRQALSEGRPMSWAAVGEAVSTGLVTIGARTHTHPRMDRIAETLIGDELDRSISLIGDRVGVHPDYFAYPYGVLGSTAAQAAVKQRFRSAALGRPRPNRYMKADVQHLQRYPIQATDGILCGGMWFEDRLGWPAGPRIPR